MEKFSLKKRLKSFTHASRGIGLFLKTTHNSWIQVSVFVIVVALGLYFNITNMEWVAVIFAGGLVLVCEALNTAIEIHMGLTSPGEHPFARDTKDVAAGAVLISAIVAAVIGLLVFVPYFVTCLSWKI